MTRMPIVRTQLEDLFALVMTTTLEMDTIAQVSIGTCT